MSVDEEIGGYPVEWFVKAPSENFKCGICLDVLKNPHQCKNGHTFCHSCVSLALTKHLECPTCKTALSLDTLSLSSSLRNVIDEMLVVKCCHDDGCEWTGTLEQSVKHFSLCSMRSVPCPLHAHHVCTDKKCSGSIQRKDVHKHLSEGSKRDHVDAMLIMAETIDAQKREIELLHKFVLSGETKIHKIGQQSTFVGTLKDGEMEGFGFLKDHEDGFTYSGHFKKGVCCGFGVLRLTEEMWSGDWKDNRLNGHGMVRCPETTYIGDFKNNNRHGFGMLICTNTTYVGSFEDGLLHGEVTRLNSNDDKLECTYENTRRCTTLPCTLTDKHGAIFIGVFDDNHYLKEGKLTTAAGVVYQGTFCDNANKFRLNGTGTITYTNGSIYRGEFRRGLKHGKGSLFDSNGTIPAAGGDWVNDKLVTFTSVTISKPMSSVRFSGSCSDWVEGEVNGSTSVGMKRKHSE